MQPTTPRRRAQGLDPRTLWVVTGLVGLLVALKLLAVIVSGLSASTDLRAYTAAAANIGAGQPIYWLPIDPGGDPPSYLYPPFPALLFMLLGPYTIAWPIWAVISLACWAAALGVLLRELAPDLDRRLGPRGWPVLWAGLLIFPPLVLHLIWGQIGLPILLCLSAGWYALRRGHDGRAGVALGVAIALKVYPALLLLPLLIQRRWHAIGAATAVAAVLTLGGFAVVGLDQSLLYLRDILPAVSALQDAGNYALRERLPAPLFGLTGALVLAVVAYVAWRGDLSDAFALGTTGILLLSPVVWGHYFVLALLPWLCALARASRAQIAWLIVALALISTASAVFYVPGPTLQLIAQWSPTLGVATLLAVQIAQARTAAGAEGAPRVPGLAGPAARGQRTP